MDFSQRAGLPLLLVQDCLGYGPDLINNSSEVAALIAAYKRNCCPRICLVVGAGHVLGTFALGSHEVGIDTAFAWPWARISPRDASSYATAVLERLREDGPWDAAGFGLIDDVLTPSETKPVLGHLLEVFAKPPREPDVSFRLTDI